MSLIATTEPKYEAADATAQKILSNAGGVDILYATTATNLPGSPDGTLEPGDSLTASQGYWFATESGTSALNVRALTLREELGTSGYTVVKLSKESDYTLETGDSKAIVIVPAPGEGKEAKVTVPANATAGIPVGSDVQIWKQPAGLGTVKIVPGAGCEVFYEGSALEESGQSVSAPFFLVKVAANEWLIHE